MSDPTNSHRESLAVLEEVRELPSISEGSNSDVLNSMRDIPAGLLLPETQLRESADVEDDDYSTDSSVGGRQQQQQQQQQQEIRPPNRRRRPPRISANREDRDINSIGHSIVLPEVYRHSGKPSQKIVYNYSRGLYLSDPICTGIEDVTSVSLEDLVNYSSSDLLSRAWPLVPLSAKNLKFAPFSELPELPDILNVRHPDTHQVARFMRLTAVEITKRHTFPTPVFLRSLLVRAAASFEERKAEQSSLSVHLHNEESISSSWEHECLDPNEIDTDEGWSFNSNIIPSTDINFVDPMDWIIAIISESLHPKIPIAILRSLHRVVDRCGINSSSSTLHSYGLQNLTRILLFQVEKVSNSEIDSCTNEWLISAITLLFKIILASKNIDFLLSIFRWIYRHQKLANELVLKGIAGWITSMETYTRPRIQLTFPVSWTRSHNIPLAHSLELEFCQKIIGICVTIQSDEPHGIIFTDKGIYKIILKPPYNIIRKNEDTHVKKCCGVFIEDNKIVVQSERAEIVTFYDLDTLQIRSVLDVSECKKKEEFQIYYGMGNFVSPHFYHNELSPLYAGFDPSLNIKGTLEPNIIIIPSETNSISIQFFLCIEATQQNTSLELIHLNVSGKVWLSVRISIDSRKSVISIIFEHNDVVAEIRETIQEGWTLWTATLIPTNDVASWTIYKDGVLLDSNGGGGVMLNLSSRTSASMQLIEGTFSGFISGIQVWHHIHSISELLAAATGKIYNSIETSLLCFFKLNEGSGCCFRNSKGAHIWKGTTPTWSVPKKSIRKKGTEKSEIIPYIPSGNYYVVTNVYESVIVENEFCTWIDENGLILEQRFINVKPEELYYLCTNSSRLYSVISENINISSIRWIDTNIPPTKYIKNLASIKNGMTTCTKVLEIIKENKPITPVTFSYYLLHRLNINILGELKNNINTCQSSNIFMWNYSSSKTLSRLVDICVELIEPSINIKKENDFVLFLNCVCGRMLTQQLSWIGRGCPPKLVPIVVNMYERFNEQLFITGSFLAEIQMVFSRLHRIFLVQCVSHDYQLQRILESKKLTDIKDLLVPEYLPSLVASIIEKDLKKPFMTFLNRLKEECLAESESVINGKSTPFKSSSATLATLLSILSRKTNPQWQLVSIALLSSLCKGILRIFNRIFPSNQSVKGRIPEQLDILKHTSIGVVVFPIAHFLSDIEIDSSIAVDALSMLNEMREALTSYAPKLPHESITHSLTETHRVFTPATSTYTSVLDLRHAQSIEVLYENSKVEEVPQLQISLLTNEYKRIVETMNSPHLVFDCGGKIEITSTPTGKNKETIITVNAKIQLKTESTHWIRDICFALSHAILRITNHLLLTDLPDTIILPRESLFRGGLSQEILKEHRVNITIEERLLDKSDQIMLIQLCENTGELISDWQSIYLKKRVPYQERLEPFLRLFCSAHVWHSNRPKNISLKKSLEDSLEFMRKKAFLILEGLQQGNGNLMLERAKFLLKMVNPRARIESIIAEHQQTEEPITGISPSASTRVMPNARSVASITSFSRDKTGSQSTSFMRRMHTGMSDLSLLQHDGMGSILRPRNSLLTSGAINEGIQSSPETISSQVLNFILYGYNGVSNEELIKSLVKKAQQATIHTAAYRLQEELCAAYQSDEDMAWSIVSSHLIYQELVYLQYKDLIDDTEEGINRKIVNQTISSRSDSIDHHYIELMIGCGFHRELELQKASCNFVHSVLQQSLLNHSNKDVNSKYHSSVGAVSLCAILCHPWDSVDMSIIRPAKIFSVLKKYIFAYLEDFIPSTSELTNEKEIWSNFIKECGIFNLLYRSVIIPNTLQPSAERINIVEGDTLGVHVEDSDVCCLARNHWRALKPETTMIYSSMERDYFANLQTGHIVSDMPEALYFELTLELVLNDQAFIAIGLASSPLSSTASVGKDNSVVFCSDGTVRYGRPSIQFSSIWSVGDVIGCGVLAPFNSIFFTRNGEFLGIATECSSTTMIPLVAVQAVSTLVKLVVNFGKNSPFKFNISSLHSSCRTYLTSPTMLSDSAFITAHYLVTLCFKNLLRHEKSESTVNEDSVCALLEESSVFLREVILDLVRRLKHTSSENSLNSSLGNKNLQNGSILLARLFRTVNIIIDCFRFNSVTSTTHVEILRLCSITLIDAHDRWSKVRAARCLGNAARTLRQDYFGEAVQALRRFVTPEVIVESLTELARAKVFREREPAVFLPRWVGGVSVVTGKGPFYGASPMPAKGTHMVGFRIRRRQQEGRGTGAPLGGCYYIGLAHGHPPVSNMTNLISRDDVYVLQDTDDQDQVPHLLLRRHCIPRSSQRRIYGNDEIVWVELNSDLGEITYYRDKMVPIGLAFANIQRVDDLYPFVFHFNEDASCELIQAPPQPEDPCELLLSGLRRSVAFHTLQQLHIVPYFCSTVSQWIHRFLARSQQNLDNCLVALAILGGEKSCEFCQHETHGAVVVDSISDIASKAIVYLEADGDMRLFATNLSNLKPSFVRPPIFSFSETESLKCSSWLVSELCRSLYEASVIVPLMNVEEESRGEVESNFFKMITNTLGLDFVGLLSIKEEVTNITKSFSSTIQSSIEILQSTSTSFKIVDGKQPFSKIPVTIDRKFSTNSIYTPNPSIGVTCSNGYSIIRGNILLESIFSFAVSITTTARKEILLYVGVSSDTELSTDPQMVAHSEKTWALCSNDAAETNCINCSVEPGMIFSAEHILFTSGDIVIVQVNRRECTVSFSRIRAGKRVDFGILFETIPNKEKIRPFILTGPESVVVFSFLDCCTFPARNIFPPSSIKAWKSISHSVRCSSCEIDLLTYWYEGKDGIYLCQECFSSWQHPKSIFCLSRIESPFPDYIASRNCPKELIVGEVVEFVENTVLTWLSQKSINVDIEGSTCMAKVDTAFATLEPFSIYGNQRIDISLGHIAGINGFPFGGLQPFIPLWRIGNTSKSFYNLESDTILVSSTVIPKGTKANIELNFLSQDDNRSLNNAGIFIGVTNLPCHSRIINIAELERHITNHNIWGTWCDAKVKATNSFNVHLLIDTTRCSVMISSSLSGLHMHPIEVTCNCPTEDESNLRVMIFSHDPCHIKSMKGFISSSDGIVEPNPFPIAIGLISEDIFGPGFDIMSKSCFLFDTASQTIMRNNSSWILTPFVEEINSKILFAIGDILTITLEKNILTVYRNGLLIGTRILSKEDDLKRKQIIIYFSTRGMTATIVPPLYGKSHLGKVIKTYGKEVGVVECLCPCQGKNKYAVRKKDLRFCALSAESTTVKVGSIVAFKAGSLNAPKRGIVTSIENNTANVRDEEDKRTWFSVEMGSLYLLDNEGPDQVSYDLHPLITLPSSSVTRVFEVGKTKYQIQCKGSYNGIMFDIQAHDAVVLTGLSIMTQTTGRHRVDVFFKKGSHHTHQRDSAAWTRIFSNLVEMHAERQFSVTFSGIHVESNATFALYINATHNCGIGHYSKDDGCTGAISNKMDSDGTLTVFVGRTSESSSPFLDTTTTPRGFCGSIMYIQSKDTRPSLMEKVSSAVEISQNKNSKYDDTMILRSRPNSTFLTSSLEFFIEVYESPISIQKIIIPLIISSNEKKSLGLSNLRISLFYSFLNDYVVEKDTERKWIWAYHAVIPFQYDLSKLYMENLSLYLRRGKYIFNTILEKNIGDIGNEKSFQISFLLKPNEENYIVKNRFYSIRGFAGDIYASSTNNVIMSENLCTISTGGHLSQNNSASYNGIMFDIRSKRDILLEEVFCVAQTTTDNVNVKIFWKEGSMEGSEKMPSHWHQIVSKDLYLADKQPFSPGPLNLQLRANQMYSLYINTTSSCGVRFYNSSDGHVGDVGDEFEDDGVLTIFVGKKSESPLPFAEIPTEPRALRGRITYRSFVLKPSLTRNQAIFPALKGFVLTRILAALIAYVGGASFDPKIFEDKIVIESLSKLATSKSNTICDPEITGNLLSCVIKGTVLDELRDSIVTLPLSQSNITKFSSFGKGDLAIIASNSNNNNNSIGSLVRLINNPDKNYMVLVKDETNINKSYTLLSESLLPIIECSDCHQPFAIKRICKVTGKPHLPASSEEDRLINILTKYFSYQCNLSFDVCLASARSLVRDPTSLISYFDEHSNIVNNGNCSGVAQDNHTIVFTISHDLFIKEKGDRAALGFICPFVYLDVMNSLVSISFTPSLESWKVVFFSDLPFRLNMDKPLRVFTISLGAILKDGSRQDLLSTSSIYYAIKGGQIHQTLPTLASLLHYSSLKVDGIIRIYLDIQENSLPSPTPSISTPKDYWVWEDGSDYIELKPNIKCNLKGKIDFLNWPKSKPRFWQFTVSSLTNNNVFFLEIRISIPKPLTRISWEDGRMHVIRRSFNLARDEKLNIGFTIDGDFIIYDEEDNIRCHVTLDEIHLESSRNLLPMVSFVNVGYHPISIHLHPPIIAKTYNLPNQFSNNLNEPVNYSPEWVSYDQMKVSISRNGLTASCNGVTGQAVIGSQLPMTGLSAFVLQVDRTDRSRGDSLGSGHFAGIVISTFSEFEPHFEMLREQIDSVWAVQDVYDVDSLPTQERIPPIRDSGNEIFLVGTKLYFILDREDGTLSLARDNESPRIVFRNIPLNVPLSPFVRLDNPNTSATLSSFTCGKGVEKVILTSPSILLTSHPITPTIPRKIPYRIVISIFNVFRYLINKLPSYQVTLIEKIWEDHFNTTKFSYRLSIAVKKLVEIGAFSRRFVKAEISEVEQFCKQEEVNKIIMDLSILSEKSIVVIPGRDGNESVILLLPEEYEIIGYVGNGLMVHLLYFDENGPNERTLHIFSINDSEIFFNPCNIVTKHPYVMFQENIIQTISGLSYYGIITHGWYDCTLDSLSISKLNEHQQKFIAKSLISALEHWHLHGIPHGHISMKNIYIRMGRGNFINCSLWNIHCLQRYHSSASPEFKLHGIRDMKGDKWSCANIISNFTLLLKNDSKFKNLVNLLINENIEIFEILNQTGIFSEESKKTFDGQILCLRTGSHLNTGAGSYNGIMFDLVAKQFKIKVTKISFFPDSTTSARVTLFARDGTFMGFENEKSEWRIVLQRDIELVDKIESELTDFEPINISAGERVALFLHTTSGSGVLFYSEADGVRANMASVEEEDDYIGITVGKKSENATPFLGIQNQKRFLKGSITYALVTNNSGYRSHLVLDSVEQISNFQNRIGMPVVVLGISRKGLIINEKEDESLVYLDNDKCEWVNHKLLKKANFEESPTWEQLDATLQKKLLEKRKLSYEKNNQYPYSHQISFFKRVESTLVNDNNGNLFVEKKTWWLSDFIKTSCIISAWQINALPDTSLFLVSSSENSSIDFSNMINIMNHGQSFIYIDEWGRSVTSLHDSQKIIKKLHDNLLNSQLRLAFGPIDSDSLNVPIVAFVTKNNNDDIIVKPISDNMALVSIRPGICLEESFVLNSVMVNCLSNYGKEDFFAGTSSLLWHRDLRITQIPSIKSNDKNILYSEENGNNNWNKFLVEMQSMQNWFEEDVFMQEQSQSLKVFKNCVEQISYGGSSICNVTKPIFGGAKMHEVNILIINSINNPVQVNFQNLTANWSVTIPLPCFNYQGETYISSSACIKSIHVCLRVFPWVKRALASINGGIMYEVLPGIDCPSEFQLSFSLSGPGSSVKILNWRVIEKAEPIVTHDMLEMIWSQLKNTCISPNVSHSVGILTRHSRTPVGILSPRNSDVSLVSQIEAVIISYARQLLGTVISVSKPSTAYRKLQELLSFTPLRNDLLALEGLVSSEIRRSSFCLLGTSYTYLANPAVGQSLEKVETSVNIIYVSLNNEKILQFLSTSFGPTLLLLLLRTATVYTRSIRHMALRCVLKLLKSSQCALPSHEVLCASFQPLLGMMNGLCRKGKMSSIVVQLGISLICELIRRYQLERPKLSPPGKKSAVPYAIATCTKAAINAIISNPPTPLPKALTEEPKEVHRINFEIRTGTISSQGFTPCYGIFTETFRCTFGIKKFEVVLSATRRGNIVVGWDMDAILPGSLSRKTILTDENSVRTLLPSCGFLIDSNGKIFVCLNRKKESQPLKVRAKGGDILLVKCLYHEQAVIISLRRGSRNESTTRFETYPNEMLSLPVFFAENFEDATFNGELLSEVSTGMDVAQLYNKLQQFPDLPDTEVIPQSYEFYAELALFCQGYKDAEQLLSSLEKDEPLTAHSHDLASFPTLSAFLGASAFSNQIPLGALAPYIKRLRIFDVLTSVFSVVVDLKRKTELFEIWKRLKNLCSLESSEKIQNETMRPFRNRPGQKASVIIHTMQARPSIRLGPYPTLMRSVFGQLFVQLQRSPISTFYTSPMFTVKLAGFGSTDAGGPYRDILSQLATEIMTTHPNGTFQLNPLFVQCGRGGQSAVMPNISMALNFQSSVMFEFFGKLLAACFITKDLIAVEFPPIFWKFLLSEETSVRDLIAIDPDILRQLTPEELMDRTVDELEERFPGIQENWMTFCTENPHLNLEIDIPPQNICSAKILAEQISSLELHKYDIAMSYIQHGFDEVIPLYTLNAFRWQQVELTICGTPKLSFDALREICEVNLPANDAKMFFDVLASMTDEDRMLLLRFTTGQTRLPIKEAIKVQRSGTHDSLPTSSTCFFTLRLPSYSSADAMRERILYAIRQCKAIDTDGQAREHIVLDS